MLVIFREDRTNLADIASEVGVDPLMGSLQLGGVGIEGGHSSSVLFMFAEWWWMSLEESGGVGIARRVCYSWFSIWYMTTDMTLASLNQATSPACYILARNHSVSALSLTRGVQMTRTTPHVPAHLHHTHGSNISVVWRTKDLGGPKICNVGPTEKDSPLGLLRRNVYPRLHPRSIDRTHGNLKLCETFQLGSCLLESWFANE